MAMDRNEPHCRVVRFEATDGIGLAGLLYEPKRATTRAAIYLHGTGGSSVFESKRTNKLAQVFTNGGVAWFPFNNRGAHVMRRMGDVMGGMAYERIRDCVFDLDGAIRELRRRGYRDITLIGHSTGANKVAVYDFYKERVQAKRYVLLAGGDDTGMIYARLGAKRFTAALTKAREMIRARRDAELVPSALSDLPMSWTSFYDMANPDGDYNVFPFLEVMRNLRLSRKPRFRHIRGIRKPTLVLYGENDEYCYGNVPRCVAILDEALGPKPNMELAIMKDADHGFSGREEELGTVIVEWITA
ncbi:MAG TPA: alpha/beta fold hydrolase [Thermoanaerobaculia bacterium]|nr:alpha/beta fold hydrolase [Thermoanaerobaculia bacterium]